MSRDQPTPRPEGAPRGAPASQGAAGARALLPPLMEWDQIPAEQLAERFEELVTWVRWLRSRYRLNREAQLPECWSEHPELIEELAALKASREEAYSKESASGPAAVAWHQALASLLERTTTRWARGCRAGHKPHPIDWDSQREQALTGRWDTADPLAGLPPDYPIGPTDPPDDEPVDPPVEPLDQPADDQWDDELPDGLLLGGGPQGGRVAADQMAALLASGQAAPLGRAVPSYVTWDGDWWVQTAHARPGALPPWLRITDPTTSTLLDAEAHRLASTDAAAHAASAPAPHLPDPAPPPPTTPSAPTT